MRRIGSLFLLLLFAFPALADSFKIGRITVGTFTYLGTNSQGNGQYEIAFNTTGVTAEPLLLDVGIGSQIGAVTYGPFTTVGPPIVITQSLGCPCTFLGINVYFNNGFPGTVTFLLANGQSFEALQNTNSPRILPLPGNSFVEPGQSGPIIIQAVPEPGTMLLFGSGLAGLIARRGLLKKPVTRYLR